MDWHHEFQLLFLVFVTENIEVCLDPFQVAVINWILSQHYWPWYASKFSYIELCIWMQYSSINSIVMIPKSTIPSGYLIKSQLPYWDVGIFLLCHIAQQPILLLRGMKINSVLSESLLMCLMQLVIMTLWSQLKGLTYIPELHLSTSDWLIFQSLS